MKETAQDGLPSTRDDPSRAARRALGLGGVLPAPARSAPLQQRILFVRPLRFPPSFRPLPPPWLRRFPFHSQRTLARAQTARPAPLPPARRASRLAFSALVFPPP